MQIKTDVTVPSGSLVINGDTPFANSLSVSLAISATDNSGSVASMRFSNDGVTWSGWESYATTKAWTLTGGDGPKTVYAQFRDTAENLSSPCSDTIVLDATPPTDGSLMATGGYHQVMLNWSGFTDSLSGLSVYKLTYSTNGFPGSWPNGTLIYSGTATTYMHTNLDNGMTCYYRVTALDNAGNASPGAVAQATPSAAADSDGDGMPDWWEEQYFGGGTNGIANNDDDHDGMKNWEEYIAGTVPTNGQSVFRMVATSAPSQGASILQWLSATNRYYAIDRSTNLTVGFSSFDNWILGTPPMNTYTDVTPPPAASFYRIKVTAPDFRTVNDELIGTGNGSSFFFYGVLIHTNIVPRSLSILAGFTFSDNGHGVLSAFIGSGTIDYVTGAWTLTLLGPLGNGVPITADYRYIIRQ